MSAGLSATIQRRCGENIRRYYNVPAQVGGRVVADGKPGTIERFDTEGAYLWVRRDGEPYVGKWHPTWRMVYEVATRRDAWDYPELRRQS